MQRIGREAVIDTSVVVKFFIREPDSEKAEALLQSFLVGAVRLVAPDFLFLEFVNVLWIKTRRVELTEREAERMIGQLLALSPLMEIVPATALLVETFRTSREHEHTAYDAAFLALAEGRSMPLVTADRRFYRKARLRSRAVLLLSDLQI